MTAPDPPAAASVGARFETWEAEVRAHERAQVLAEVDAALRDTKRWNAWLAAHTDPNLGRTWAWIAADYLRDTLAGDGGKA